MQPSSLDITAAQARARSDELIRQLPFCDLDLVEEFFELAVEYKMLAREIEEQEAVS